MDQKYMPEKIEPAWQKKWEDEKATAKPSVSEMRDGKREQPCLAGETKKPGIAPI